MGETQARLRNSTSRNVMGVCSSDTGTIRRWAPGSAVRRSRCRGSARSARGRSADRRDAAEHARDVDEAGVGAHDAGRLGALEQLVAGARDRDAAGPEDRRRRSRSSPSISSRQRALRGREADELAQPGDERVPRLQVGRDRQPTGRSPRPRRGRRPRAGAGASGSGGRACRCRPARAVRCPRARPTCRPRRRPRAPQTRASRSCGGHLRAGGAAQSAVTSVSAFGHGARLLVRLTIGGTLRILNRRDPPISSGGCLHFSTDRSPKGFHSRVVHARQARFHAPSRSTARAPAPPTRQRCWPSSWPAT